MSFVHIFKIQYKDFCLRFEMSWQQKELNHHSIEHVRRSFQVFFLFKNSKA